MITRTLLNRLKRIEARCGPRSEPVVHIIHFIDSDGTDVETMRIVHGDQPQIVADQGR
jgi:hypothetical protein